MLLKSVDRNCLPRRRSSSRPSFACGTIAAAFFLCSCAIAMAGDYSVAYAIDMVVKRDMGTVESCEYDKECVIKSDSLGLSIVLSFPRRKDRWLVVLQVNGPPGCCYSVDAAKKIFLHNTSDLQGATIFEGGPRTRNEFVANKHFANLYFAFSRLR